MLLDLDEVDRVGAFGPLLVQEGVQLRDVHGLDQVVDLAQLGGFEVDQRVEVAELLEGLRARGVELPFGVAQRLVSGLNLASEASSEWVIVPLS